MRSKVLSEVSSFLALPGTKQEAFRLISDWCERNLSDKVKIHDPFFGPEDLHWLQTIRAVRPQCQICVITSRKHQPKLNPSEELDEVYSASWKSTYDQQPPKAEIVIIGGERTGMSPIHDRWLVSDGVGLRFGTSLKSLGDSKESDVSEMSSEDAEERSAAMEKYLNREAREFNGEKLRLMRFWLT